MVQLEILLPTMHYQCHYQCRIKCSKCPPLTSSHAFRRLVKSLLTALLIGSYYLNTEFFVYTFVCQMNLRRCNVTNDVAFTLDQVLSFFVSNNKWRNQ